jgi:uncharacterized damage-inducible protein DinB
MLQSVSGFISYFEGIRRRTIQFIQTVPPDRIAWAPQPGEMSCGDLVRHLAAGEQMFVGAVVRGRWLYTPPDPTSPDTLEAALADLHATHAAALEQLRALPDSTLLEPRPTLNGPPTKAWRLLMAMVEHEIHHRSQIAMYLSLMGVPPPHIYGLGVEDVIALATG